GSTTAKRVQKVGGVRAWSWNARSRMGSRVIRVERRLQAVDFAVVQIGNLRSQGAVSISAHGRVHHAGAESSRDVCPSIHTGKQVNDCSNQEPEGEDFGRISGG